MRLLGSLIGRAPYLFVLSVLTSIAAAVLTLLLVGVISSEISGRGSTPISLGTFAMLVFCTVAVGIWATLCVNRISVKATRDLSFNLITDILSSSLIEIERTGKSGVAAALVEDIPRVVDVLPAMVHFLRHCVFILCCFIYLGVLSPSMLGITLLVAAIGVGMHHVLQLRGTAVVSVMSDARENLLHTFRDIVDGVKQLKLGDVQRRSVVGHAKARARQFSELHAKSAVYFIVGGNLAMLVFYVLIGLILFPAFSATLPTKVVTGYAVCLFMMLGPLQGLVGSGQSFAQGLVAFNRIERLRKTLSTTREHQRLELDDRQLARPPIVVPRGLKLDLRGIRHIYDSGDREQFVLGPVDLCLRSGELVFVVGGNGSGKTTLAKLLTGLYVPMEGEISLDGTLVDGANRDWFRSHFCAVFSDFCLFDSLATAEDASIEPHMVELLRTLRLDHIISTEKGLLSQARTFSTGERRRVALMLAYLEDRAVYVFDEFAADQDPSAKEIFYKGVLPDLARRGKLVIVITHDTRYFELADQIVRLERGVTPVVQSRLPDAADGSTSSRATGIAGQTGT